MMKKLGFHDRAKILVSAEPPQWEPDTNTGFWIIKQSKVATDALERIMRCPDESESRPSASPRVLSEHVHSPGLRPLEDQLGSRATGVERIHPANAPS